MPEKNVIKGETSKEFSLKWCCGNKKIMFFQSFFYTFLAEQQPVGREAQLDWYPEELLNKKKFNI